MTLLPRSATMLFLGATPEEVVELISNSELPEGGKFDRQYPGAREAILNGFLHYGNAYPNSVYAWSRWILPIMKKRVVPAVFAKFDEHDPQFVELVKVHQENLDAAIEKLSAMLAETGGTVPDDTYTYTKLLNNVEYAQSQLEKVKSRPAKNRQGFDNDPTTTLWTTRTDESYDTMSGVFRAFQTIKSLADRYNIRINLNEFNSVGDVMQRQHSIEREVEEKENERQYREGFKSGRYQWDAKPIYKFKDGWAVWPIESGSDLELEGEIMNHCIGDPDNGHFWRIQQGGSSAVSLRSPDGISHATAELSADGKTISSLYGYRDHALNEDYQKRMKEYFDQSGVDRDSEYYTGEQWAGGSFDDAELGAYDNEQEELEPEYLDDEYWSESGLDPPVWGSNARLSNPYDYLMEMLEWDEKVEREGQEISTITSDYQDDEDQGYDTDDGRWQSVYYTRKAIEPPFSHGMRHQEIVKVFTEAMMKEIALGVGGKEFGTQGPRNVRRLHEMAKGFAVLEELTGELDADNGHISSNEWHNALAEATLEYPDNEDVNYFMSMATQEYAELLKTYPEDFEHEDFIKPPEQEAFFTDDEWRSTPAEDWQRYNERNEWRRQFPEQEFPQDKPFDIPEGTEMMYKDEVVTVNNDNPPYGILVTWPNGTRGNVPRSELHSLNSPEAEANQVAMPVDPRWMPGSKLMWRGQPVEVVERNVDVGPDQSDWVKVKILGQGGDANYPVGEEKLLPKKDNEGRELFNDMPTSYPPTPFNEGDRVVMKTDPGLKGTFVQYRNNDPQDQLASVQWDLPSGATSLDDNVRHSDLKGAPLEPGTEMLYNGAPVTIHLDWNDGPGTTEVKSPNGHLFTVDRGDLKPMDYEAPVEDGSLVGKKFWYGPGARETGGALQVTVEENDDRRARIRMPDGTTGYTLIQSLGDPVEEAPEEDWRQREPLFTPGTEIYIKGENDERRSVEVVEDKGAYLTIRHPGALTEREIPAVLLAPQERDTSYGQPGYQEEWGENHELVGQKFTLGTTPITIEAVGEAGYARVRTDTGDTRYCRLGELTAPQQTDEEWGADYLRRQQTPEFDRANEPDPEAHADGAGGEQHATAKPIEEWASDGSDGFYRILPNGKRIEYPMGGFEEGQRVYDDVGGNGDYVFSNGAWTLQAPMRQQPEAAPTNRDPNIMPPGTYDGERLGDYEWHVEHNPDGGRWVSVHGPRAAKVSAAGQNWVYLNGQVARGAQPHHLLIHRVGEGYDGEPILGQLSNTWLAANGLPQGLAHDVARGHYDAKGRPAIWESNLDRNVVWDAVKAHNPVTAAGNSPFGDHMNKPGEAFDPHLIFNMRDWLGDADDLYDEDVIDEMNMRYPGGAVAFENESYRIGSLNRGIQPAARSYDRSYEEMYAQLQGMGWDVMSSGPKAGLFCITIKNNETGGQVERTGKTQEQAAASAPPGAWHNRHKPSTTTAVIRPAGNDYIYDSMGDMMMGTDYAGEAINSYTQGGDLRGTLLYKIEPSMIWVDSIYSKDTEGAMEMFGYLRQQYPGQQLEGMFMNPKLKALADRYNQGNGHTPMTDPERHEKTGIDPMHMEWMRPAYERAEQQRRGAKNKGYKALHQLALSQGWRDKQISNGWMLLAPDGINKATYHLSESDYRGLKNFMAQLQRGGLMIPPDFRISHTEDVMDMDLPIASQQTLGQVFASLKPDPTDGNKLGLQAFKLGYSMDDLRTFLELQDEDYQPGFKVFKEHAISAYASRGWSVQSALKLVLWNAITGQRGGPMVNSLEEGQAIAAKQMESVNADGQQIIYRAQVIDPMFPGSPKWDTDDDWEGFKTEDWARLRGQKNETGWEQGKEIPIQRQENVPVDQDWAFTSSEEAVPDFTFIYYQGALEVEPYSPNLRPNVMLKKILDLTGKEITDYNVDDNKIGAGDIYKRDGEIDVKLNSLCDQDVQQAALDSVHQWAQGMNLVGPIQPPVQHA